MPRIELEFTERAESFTVRLSIYLAIASEKLRFSKNAVSWRVFVHLEERTYWSYSSSTAETSG